MTIRDRIKSFRRVKASDLKPHPKNWRRHPEKQRRAMQAILDEVGYAGAAIAYEKDGELITIDGHLRSSLDPDQKIPTLILEVDDDEAEKILISHDPLAMLAEMDEDILRSLIKSSEPVNDELKELFEDLKREADRISFEPDRVIGENDTDEEWQGMPEFDFENQDSWKRLIVHFDNEKDLENFAVLVQQSITTKTKSIYFPKKQREKHLDKAYVSES